MKKLSKVKKAEKARAEYIKVESNVHLHVTDAGEGRPIVLIPGWPLSDEMYEYQYNNLINLTDCMITMCMPRISERF